MTVRPFETQSFLVKPASYRCNLACDYCFYSRVEGIYTRPDTFMDHETLDALTEKGEFGELLAWLNKNVHAHGAKFYPQELVKRITGEKINGDAYIRYLNNKFSNIYGL